MGASSSKQAKQDVPPPYSCIIHKPRIQCFAPHCPGIKAYDVPQWKWSKEQCRTWIYITLVEKYSWAPDKALEAAQRFHGSGVDMYRITMANWREVIGTEWEGNSIHYYIYSVKRDKGAVPQGINMPHWNNKKEIQKTT